MRSFMAVLGFLSVLWGDATFGQTQSVNFTATVSSVFNQNGNGLALASSLGIAVGDTIAGRYFFNPNHPDGSLDPNIGLYNNISSPFVINLQTASRLYNFQSNLNRITVWNQATFDEIDVISLSSVISNLPAGTTLGQMNVFWNDQSATALSSEALIAPPQFPWNFKRVRLLAFEDGNGNQFGLFAEINSFAPSLGYVVINTNNSGAGSLRQAILDARSDGGPSIITFDPTVFPATINMTSLLPSLNEPGDTIDGGGIATLNAVNLTEPSDHGVRIFAGNIAILGLTIQNFGGTGIRVQPIPGVGQTLTGITISNNLVGKNGDGIVVLGGEGDNRLEVIITGNELAKNDSDGIAVSGSVNTGIGENNVEVTIIANSIASSSGKDSPLSGDGIRVVGGTGTNAGNNVIHANISANDVQSSAGEGIRVVGAGTGSSSSNNIIDATLTGNQVKNSGLGPTGSGNGITISGGPTPQEPATTSANMVTFVVDDNVSMDNRDNGIGIQGSNGSNHIVTGIISNNAFQSNTSAGIFLTGRGGSFNLLQDIEIQFNQVTKNGDGGVVIFGGDSVNTDNATITNVLVNGNSVSDNGRHGFVADLGTGVGNSISFAAITNNVTSKNGAHGLRILEGINGNGATPISGNRADRNQNSDQDGINISSTGYVLSGNRAERNARFGIRTFGNTNGGGNISRRNGDPTCDPVGCF